jgi:hypothetical protein
MEDWQFCINKRRIRKAFPDFLHGQYLYLPLGGLSYFLEISEGLVILIEVKAGVGGDEGILEELLHLRPVLVDALHAEIPVEGVFVRAADDPDL